jgi:hypothetical protein
MLDRKMKEAAAIAAASFSHQEAVREMNERPGIDWQARQNQSGIDFATLELSRRFVMDEGMTAITNQVVHLFICSCRSCVRTCPCHNTRLASQLTLRRQFARDREKTSIPVNAHSR